MFVFVEREKTMKIGKRRPRISCNWLILGVQEGRQGAGGPHVSSFAEE